MNPMAQAALAAIFRWALTIGAGYLVARGIWTQEEAATYVIGGALALTALLWSVYQKYVERSKLVTALSMPPTTESHVEQAVKAGVAPPVTTPKDVTPSSLP